MKKFTKILIALGAAGIAKYIYDHVDIVTNEELEEKIKKEAEVIAKEKACRDDLDKVDKEILDLNKKSGHYTIGSCDHIYYDNPYNISKIYLDKNECPQAFEFDNEKDRNDALEAYYNYFKDCNNKMSMVSTFYIVGLIPDDYPDFKKYFVVWDPEDFMKANAENAIPKTINFGKFEK